MSDELYPTRLRWHHGRGLARCGGVQVDLRQAPHIHGLEAMTELDYIPNIIATVRVACDAMRDLSHDEIHDALALLQRMSSAARDAVEARRR